MEWPIRDVARATGLSSRALRHYEQIGLLHPSRTAANGYRFYGDAEIAQIYRILSLRALGLPLETIRQTADDELALPDAMESHLALLKESLEMLTSKIANVERTLNALRKCASMSIDDVFSGSHGDSHESEVRNRWGNAAWEHSARRRASMSDAELARDDKTSRDVNASLRRAAEEGADPSGTRFQAAVTAHHQWVTEQWGGRSPTAESYAGLAAMYAADPRFAVVYGGEEMATSIRDAILVWIPENLE
ncbi:MerR family transcriptional regulator [Falsarthrobacter nasiphocae]|uniref:DNA-binding transcriptional MerR regulator n=1 Tax=Falsarthrobacter nasiphocae TaxID=189863 RepID=A0AAE3YI05_9MICC|nr:MerR family transcriptional regulator [Falsarthrobacter nasiphocae]MDR6892391.1 DNA-binding transcriptional MerR regulator [Falsarthrobacter nasiphocae]